jgi:hypothetical protein
LLDGVIIARHHAARIRPPCLGIQRLPEHARMRDHTQELVHDALCHAPGNSAGQPALQGCACALVLRAIRVRGAGQGVSVDCQRLLATGIRLVAGRYARAHHNPPPQRYCHAMPIRS